MQYNKSEFVPASSCFIDVLAFCVLCLHQVGTSLWSSPQMPCHGWSRSFSLFCQKFRPHWWSFQLAPWVRMWPSHGFSLQAFAVFNRLRLSAIMATHVFRLPGSKTLKATSFHKERLNTRPSLQRSFVSMLPHFSAALLHRLQGRQHSHQCQHPASVHYHSLCRVFLASPGQLHHFVLRMVVAYIHSLIGHMARATQKISFKDL